MKESSKVLPGIVPGEDPERVTLTVDEVAALLGVHKLTVYAGSKLEIYRLSGSETGS